MKPVNLKDIVDEMEIQVDEYYKYLNKETGAIVTISKEELGIAEESEEEDDFSQYPDWQQDSIKEALDVLLNWDDYVELPDKWEINEYDIMEDFCLSIKDNKISNALYAAIKGRGAFRRFKDSICTYGIEDNWYKFRDLTLRNIAIKWCKDNEITYSDCISQMGKG